MPIAIANVLGNIAVGARNPTRVPIASAVISTKGGRTFTFALSVNSAT